nr:hypothetical protein [Tanacetum cinerariifolium]
RHAVSGFMTNGLNMGVPPCQSNRVKSACSKVDLVFSSAVADVKTDSILSHLWERLATPSVPLKGNG